MNTDNVGPGNNSLSTFIFGIVRRTLNKSWRLFLGAFTLVSLSHVAYAQTVVPSGINASLCTFKWFSIQNWFPSQISGFLPVNGIVNPADSIHFQLNNPSNLPGFNTNCDFYRWSAQMFLWLTSPPPSNYGQGSHVFNSPIFYDVSPADATTGRRTLIRISPGKLRTFGVSIPQLGPQGKPVVFDNTGKMFTVVRPQVGPGGKTLIRNKAGKLVEIERVQVARNGKPIFLDKAGKAINFQVARNGSPLILDGVGKQINFRSTIKVINGRSFFQDGAGNLIDIEQGQADGSVLMAQNGSLVYYALEVNDVYASFLTGKKLGSITAANFPTTQPELTNIQNFAGTTFPDANALAVEIKTAWIEIAGLAHPGDYVTITATIPAYNPPLAPPFTQTGITQAVQSGTRQATLALVGMHIVGTVLGHQEMIWATFEHVNNAPNAPYTYNTSASGPTPGPPDGPGPWNFSATGASGFNIAQRMHWDSSTNSIRAVTFAPQPTIGPVDVYRKNAWGTTVQFPDGTPTNFTTNNSDVIAINNSLLALLTTGDVRRNYILTGTTWVEAGSATSNPNDPITQLGTYGMANTTMETLTQGSNCFSCHSGNLLGTTFGPPPTPPLAVGLSHIYGPLEPLVTK